MLGYAWMSAEDYPELGTVHASREKTWGQSGRETYFSLCVLSFYLGKKKSSFTMGMC